MKYSIEEVNNLLSINGFARIKKFFTNQELDGLEHLNKILIENSYNNKDSTQRLVPNHFYENTIIYEKLYEDSFLELISGIIRLQFNKEFSSEDVKNKIKIGINVLMDSSHKTPFHFDNTYINVVIPLTNFRKITKDDGALHIFPNIRSIAMPKFLNKVVTLALKYNFIRALFRHSIVNYELGNAYLFNGYNSFHGVPVFKGQFTRVVVNCAVRM